MVDGDDGAPLESRPAGLRDLVALCQNLNREGAQYVVIGGMAIIQAGFTRATEDIDLLLDTAPENLQRRRRDHRGPHEERLWSRVRRGLRDGRCRDDRRRRLLASGESGETATGEEAPPDYEQAFAASLSSVARERREAPGLYVELMEEPADRHGALVESDPRFQTWGVVELLVERSREMCTRVPARAEELARLALRTLEHLDPQRYRATLIEASPASPTTCAAPSTTPPCASSCRAARL